MFLKGQTVHTNEKKKKKFNSLDVTRLEKWIYYIGKYADGRVCEMSFGGIECN